MTRHGDVVTTAAYFRVSECEHVNGKRPLSLSSFSRRPSPPVPLQTTGHAHVADGILRCADDGGTDSEHLPASLSALVPAPVVPFSNSSDSIDGSSSMCNTGDDSGDNNVRALPGDILQMIFGMLPASNRFIAPVCRQFRDQYEAAIGEEKSHRTDTYAIGTEHALELFFEEEERDSSIYCRKHKTSLIGAGCGRIDWVERGGLFDEDTCSVAAREGQLRILQWLRARECPWDKRTCRAAARNGHLQLLKWAREEGCPWDYLTCSGAAYGGHLQLLMWAREQGCPWDGGSCSRAAAAGGHLETLKWLKEEECPLDKWTCYEAAEGGNLVVLMWLREEGCLLDEWSCRGAAESGHLEVLKWLREVGCPWDESTCEEAARFGDLEGNLEVLKWAIENGCLYDAYDLEGISDPEFLEWFKEHKF